MDHPLRLKDHKDLRRRVIQLLRTGYSVRRGSNIIFVCGGNEPDHMRNLFRVYCEENHPQYEVFYPEFAIRSYMAADDHVQFNIADFETILGSLSHVIVIFPEAPGSYAETGYFSVKSELAAKAVLVLDSKWQTDDSFISMGPGKLINDESLYYPNIQMSYAVPVFADIVKRIERVPLPRTRTALQIGKFRDTTLYERFCLIHKCVDIMSIATISDIVSIMHGVFNAQYSITNIKQLFAILVGAKYLIPVGDYGHHTINYNKQKLCEPMDGLHSVENLIRLELANIYSKCGLEFLNILENDADAA